MNQTGSVEFTQATRVADPLAPFRNVESNVRETRTMITGNLIAAMERFNRTTGQVVLFTREDGKVDPGVLMPRNFDLGAELENEDVFFPQIGMAAQFLRENDGILKSADKIVYLSHENGTRSGRLKLQIQKSNGRGRPYFLLRALQPYLVNPREQGKFYTARIATSDLDDVLRIYTENLGTRWVTDSFKEQARGIVGISMPDLDAMEMRADRAPVATLRGDELGAWDELPAAW